MFSVQLVLHNETSVNEWKELPLQPTPSMHSKHPEVKNACLPVIRLKRTLNTAPLPWRSILDIRLRKGGEAHSSPTNF